MLMPKQSPPVIRARGPSGRSPSGCIRTSEEVLLKEKVQWKCKVFDVPTFDDNGVEGDPVEQTLLAYNIPGEGGGWMQTDYPCNTKQKPPAT